MAVGDLGTVPVHALRRGIGYVIQQAGLFPHRTVADNIATVPKLLGWDKGRVEVAKDGAESVAQDFLDEHGLS